MKESSITANTRKYRTNVDPWMCEGALLIPRWGSPFFFWSESFSHRLTKNILVFPFVCHPFVCVCFVQCSSWKGLTDVVVFSARSELKAQGEGSEELELLREAQGSVGTAGAVALPALEAAHPVLAGGVALLVDHEEDVALHAPVGRRALVVRTVDVQVVVDVHRHPVLSVPEPARHRGI